MPKVKFIQPWTVAQGDGKGPVYKVGDIVELDRSYAEKYKNRGVAIDYPVTPEGKAAAAAAGVVDKPTAEATAAARRATERADVKIPKNWAEMHWPEMRALATDLTDDPVKTPIKNKDDATAAIEAELKRRDTG